MARPIRSRRFLLPALLAGLIVAACGGGGDTPYVPPPATQTVDLGTLPSTTPSRSEVTVTNPLTAQATLTASIAPSAFAPDADDLPITVDPGASATFGVLFSPTNPGVAQASLSVRFEGGGVVEQQAYTLKATAEPVTYLVTPRPLDFGGVVVGETRTLEASFTNRATLSTVTFTSAEVPNSFFSIVGAPFPLTLAPGETGSVELRYAPDTGGIHDGTLRVGPSDAGGPVEIPVMAEGLGAGSEVVTDFGAVSLDSSGRTSTLSVSVPDDAISLYLEGEMAGGTTPNVIGLYTLEGPGGKVYENSSSTGNYVWLYGWDVFSTVVPNTDRTNVQLVPGGGTYTFRLRLAQGSGSTMNVRAIVERRETSQRDQAVIPLNVFLANGIAVTAANASSDTFLQSVLSRMDDIFAQQGIRIGDIDYYDVAQSQYDEVTSEAEFSEMLKLTSAATHERLNLFFVKVALGGGVVGVSATIAGPKVNGTGMSGVMSVYHGLLERPHRPHRRPTRSATSWGSTTRGAERIPRLHRRHGRVPRLRNEHRLPHRRRRLPDALAGPGWHRHHGRPGHGHPRAPAHGAPTSAGRRSPPRRPSSSTSRPCPGLVRHLDASPQGWCAEHL